MSGALRGNDDATVREALERALAAVRGEPVAVADLSRRPFAYETSFALDELDVQLSSGESLALLVKDVGPTGLSAEAAVTKPAHTLDPGREISVYRDLLDVERLGTPRFYGAEVDPHQGRWWLFLERVDGEVLTDVGRIDIWCEVAAWAARTGTVVKGRPETLLERDRNWHQDWIDTAATVLGDDPMAGRLRTSKKLLLERLEKLPRAFVHGELYPANVLVVREGGPTRIAPVDWELAGTGPYALDLAALVSGWEGDDREAMCRTFQESLPSPGPSLEELFSALELCELSLALQWIAWSPGWEPPEAQRRDWPAEASRLLGNILP